MGEYVLPMIAGVFVLFLIAAAIVLITRASSGRW